ncbi:MAG TPA: S4 domain-containing protein, partial [Bacteroidia bacterium]|nr:S4 domain-containing protein [Bacteroidia bacterium]
MEEKTKKTAAAKASTKKAAEVSPTDKKATTKKAKDASAEKTAATAKAAPKAKAPAKAAAAKAKVAEAPVAEKPASKKAAAAKTKVAAAPVAEKPASKKAAAAKTKVADATVAEKPASKKAAAPKTKVADATVAEKPASKKAATKTVKAAKEAAPAVEAATTEESTKKVRTKPRRRELKRLGLLQPKENKKQKIFDEAQRARLGGKDTSAKKSKLSPAEIRLQAKAKSTEQKPASPAEDKAKPRDHKAEDRSEPKAKGKDSKAKAKLMPEEFGGFQKQISPKAERKNERRKERMEKAEREIDQSHGLFEEPIRLNRFVALSGICSRRDADALISDGKVKVNGKVVREMGYKVKPGQDKVVYKDHELRIKVFVYLLMNKPK